MHAPILQRAADSFGIIRDYNVEVWAFIPGDGWKGWGSGSSVGWLQGVAAEAFREGATIVSFRSPWGEIERIGDVAKANRTFLNNATVNNLNPTYFEFLGWVERDLHTGAIVSDTVHGSDVRANVDAWLDVEDNPIG